MGGLLAVLAQYGAGSARGFKWLESSLSTLSATGLVILALLTVLALVAMITARFWYRRLVAKIIISSRKPCDWFVVPNAGVALALFLYLILFPFLSLFCTSQLGWLAFMLFGWGGASLLTYYWFGIRHNNVALMNLGGEYYLSRFSGLYGWIPVSTIPGIRLSAGQEGWTGGYRIDYRNAKGEEKIWGIIHPEDYREEDRLHLIEFVRRLER